MLGWWITVYSDEKREKQHLIASWECGVSSTDWLDNLCKSGDAVQTLNNGGYPNIYQMQAKHIVPWLSDGKISPQGHTASIGYSPLKLFHPETLHNFPSEAVLTVQVYDLS